MSDDKPAFSRHNRIGEKLVELRVLSPKHVLDVFDAVAISETNSTGKTVSRTDIVNRVLSNYVDHKIDEATLIQRVLSDNPTVLESTDET